MKAVKPEDKKKMAALLVSTVLVFGLLIVRIMGAAGVSSSKPAEEVVLNSPENGVKAQPLAGTPEVKPAEMIPISNVATGGADPFRVILGDANASNSQPDPMPAPGRLTGGGVGANVPVLPGPDGGGGFGIVDPNGNPTTAPRSAVTLMGVMVGKDSVAVFNVDGKDLILRRGEVAVGKYRVSRIGVAGVTLADGKDKVELEVGGGVGDES